LAVPDQRQERESVQAAGHRTCLSSRAMETPDKACPNGAYDD